MAVAGPLLIDCPACHAPLSLPIHTDKGHRDGDRWVLNVSVDPADTARVVAHIKAHEDDQDPPVEYE